MKKNIRLGHKFIALFLIMAAIVAFTGAFGIWTVNRVGGTVQELLRVRGDQQKLVFLMKIALQEAQNYLLQASRMSPSSEEFEILRSDFETRNTFIANYCTILLNGNEKLGLPPAGAETPLGKAATALMEKQGALHALGSAILGKKAAGSDEESLKNLTTVELVDATELVKESMDELLLAVGETVTQAGEEAGAMRRAATWTFILVILAAVAVAVFLGIAISRYFVKQIGLVAGALALGAEGNLSQRLAIGSSDEFGSLGNDYNRMAESLSHMLQKVRGSIKELSEVAGSIGGAANEQAVSVARASEAVAETTAAVEGITGSINGVTGKMEQLALISSDTSSSTLEMISAMEEISQNMEQLAFRVDSVASSITEMATSIAQVDLSVSNLSDASATTSSSVIAMDATIEAVKEHAMETAAIAHALLEKVETGKNSVADTINGMKEIKSASQSSVRTMERLAQRTREIDRILTVIGEVTDQTRLLSLNAAIIAAQAGEHGRSFAVVASEIKALADKTTISTREIAGVIANVKEETEEVMHSIRQAEKAVEEGERLSSDSSRTLAEIFAHINSAAQHTDEVAQATEAQVRESQQIRAAMAQISEMISQIARATGEHGRGSRLIINALDEMRQFQAQVTKATREQSNAGKAVRAATEGINAMIDEVRAACLEQGRESSVILAAVKLMRQSVETNLEATTVMNRSVVILGEQTGSLHQEVDHFLLAAPEPERDNSVAGDGIAWQSGTLSS